MAEEEANDDGHWTFPSFSFNPSPLLLPHSPPTLSPFQPLVRCEAQDENSQLQPTEHLVDSDGSDGGQLSIPIPCGEGSRSLLPFSLNLHAVAMGDADQIHSPSPTSATTVLVARPRFWSRKIACSVCHINKERCDGGRPCSRCVRLRHTAHCVDRPSTRGKRQREQLSTEVQSVSLHLRNSGPHSPTLLPVDGALLSQYLLAAHHRSLLRLNQTQVLNDGTKLHLRRKLLEWAWHRQMMLPSDMEDVVHSVIFPRSDWYQHDHDVLTAVLTTFSSNRDIVLLASTSNQERRNNHSQCDGSKCSGFCLFLEALTAATPCVYSWLRSPSTPIPDQSESPNHALLVIKRAHDTTLSRYHDLVSPVLGARRSRGYDDCDADDGHRCEIRNRCYVEHLLVSGVEYVEVLMLECATITCLSGTADSRDLASATRVLDCDATKQASMPIFRSLLTTTRERPSHSTSIGVSLGTSGGWQRTPFDVLGCVPGIVERKSGQYCGCRCTRLPVGVRNENDVANV